ncbi:MAG TPA: sulfite exporter TauE/SafE family protein [Candidatus Saccharimonadales bacterium]|nr:sulfite exporter TauE/SafE family protein [Candidatus Saccharimonadales bacterium]
MSAVVIMALGLLVLSVVSGMLGLGVAFAALPFLALFMSDLVNQVQPLSLILNGLTALSAAIGFAQSNYVDWRRGGVLAVVTTVFAPLGALLTHYIAATLIWIIYLLSVAYLAYRLFRPVVERPGRENFRLVLLLAAPISLLSGLLGVGPGFLLMPTLIIAGFPTKLAAGMNALAVTPPSFSALLPHLGSARLDPGLTVTLVVVGVVGAFVGARVTSRFVPGPRVKQLFGVLIVVMTAFKLLTILL